MRAALLFSFLLSSSLAFQAPLSRRVVQSSLSMGILDSLVGGGKRFPDPCVMGDESLMAPKAHGTSATPVQANLRWGADRETADRICNFNRHYAEFAGYWTTTPFIAEAGKEFMETGVVEFFDSNTGKPLFVVSKDTGRSWEEFIAESKSHGWPSFRDSEVNWDYVRCLPDGECVSVDGTHLGHNIPDGTGKPVLHQLGVCCRKAILRGVRVQHDSTVK